MKKLLISLGFLSVSLFGQCDLPLGEMKCLIKAKSLENYIYDQIDMLDDDITYKEHTISHYDNLTIYHMGYQFGRRRTYYEVLDFLKND